MERVLGAILVCGSWLGTAHADRKPALGLPATFTPDPPKPVVGDIMPCRVDLSSDPVASMQPEAPNEVRVPVGALHGRVRCARALSPEEKLAIASAVVGAAAGMKHIVAPALLAVLRPLLEQTGSLARALGSLGQVPGALLGAAAAAIGRAKSASDNRSLEHR